MTRGSAQAAGVAFGAGEVLRDTYRIVGCLSEGGMGTVHLAEHVRLPRRFVVKVIARRNAGDPEAISRFRREAELVSRLHHPNIVQVLDFDTTPAGEPYLVMEHLSGETLATRLEREERLELTRAMHVMWQIASALAAAHEQGVVHRDLKPGNVFLVDAPGHDAFVKLLDFGVSKQMLSGRRTTRDAEVFGTPNYMAPEQALARDIDARTDQFALACVVHRMLAGEAPFAGRTVQATLENIVTAVPKPTSAHNAEVPPEIDVVLRKALAKDPELRFPRVSDFARALYDASGVKQRSITFSSVPPSAPTLRPQRSDEPTIDRRPPRSRSGFVPAAPTVPAPEPSAGEVERLLESAATALELGDALSAGTLAEEAARRAQAGEVDDAQARAIGDLFEQLLGGGDRRLEPHPHAPSTPLTPKLALMLSRISGEPSLDVLVAASSFPRHETLHALYGLVRRRRARIVED